MADEKKFLDAGGLGHAWEKIKTWLGSWKTEQFGSGSYNNGCELDISPFSYPAWGVPLKVASKLRMSWENDAFEIVGGDTGQTANSYQITSKFGMFVTDVLITAGFTNVFVRNAFESTVRLVLLVATVGSDGNTQFFTKASLIEPSMGFQFHIGDLGNATGNISVFGFWTGV